MVALYTMVGGRVRTTYKSISRKTECEQFLRKIVHFVQPSDEGEICEQRARIYICNGLWTLFGKRIHENF